MQRIVTAITVVALAFSLVAQATPAAAVTGYDSSYAGESAFLSLDPGDDGSFTVFFSNTGATTWTRGSSTQVNLATCLEDKVTCNQQDADEAEFNDGWLSVTAYATHTQSSVASGSLGTFTYNVTVPDDAAEDTYRFNGALVLAATGQDIHNEGYFQDVTVGEGAPPPTGDEPTLDELDPEEGTVEGGDAVTITGEGFECSPEPTVMFGDNEAEVTACGDEQVIVETPAGDAEGDVDVTVANSGGAESNALTFQYTAEETEPVFESISVEGQTITLNFSEPVCVTEGDELVFNGTDDVVVRVNGTAEDIDGDNDGEVDTDAPECDSDAADLDAENSFTVTIPSASETIVEGDLVSVTIPTSGADKIQDAAGNTMDPTTRSTEAAADTTAPTVVSVEAETDEILIVTVSEPVTCDSTTGDWEYDPDDGAAVEPTAISCDDDEIELTFADGTFSATDQGDLTYEEDADGSATSNVEDLAGNDLADFDEAVGPLEAQGPIITDAVLTETAGLSLTADSGDEFVLTFDEDIQAPANGDTIRVQDDDGTIADIECNNVVADDDDDLNASCVYNSSDNELTVTIQETSDETAGSTGDDDDLVAEGDVQGLQWPAEIIDTSGFEDSAGNDVNLADSTDVVINNE